MDIDGDGRYEFETRDNAFLYAFACYACSEAPLEVLALEDGAMKNVTAEPRYEKAHEAYLKAMIENAPDEDLNGFLAGYVGEKSLLGEGKEAWDLMLAPLRQIERLGLGALRPAPRRRGRMPRQGRNPGLSGRPRTYA